jgi:hypothetical protein
LADYETPSVPNSQLSRNTSCETIIHHPSLLNLTENIIRAPFCRLTESQVCGVPLFSLLTKTQFPRNNPCLWGWPFSASTGCPNGHVVVLVACASFRHIFDSAVAADGTV